MSTTQTTQKAEACSAGIILRVGPVTESEINTMLTASAESGEAVAQSILGKQGIRRFGPLTIEEAEYLSENLYGDADRVSMGVSNAAGRAFEKAGERLNELIKSAKAEKGAQWNGLKTLDAPSVPSATENHLAAPVNQ